jgi:transposase
MCDWIKIFHHDEPDISHEQSDEVRRLKAELRRVTEERDILKKATVYFAKQAK